MSENQYDELVPDRQARKELGDVSVMTFWRWDRHPEKAPEGWEPAVKMGASPRNYRRRGMLERVKALTRAAAERDRGAA